MISLSEVQDLFNTLKDNIEFDSDIIGIYKILKFQINQDKTSFLLNWQYILEQYDILKLSSDINFDPILKDIPILIIKEYSLQELMHIKTKLTSKNQLLIDNKIFNTFTYESGIYKILEELILNENELEELNLIDSIKSSSNSLPKEIFDFSTLLNNLIMLHIKYHKFHQDFITKLISKAPTKKDQALIKALLLDINE